MSLKNHLTIKECAILARVSQPLVYQWVKEGRLAHYRLGGEGKRGRILVDPEDLKKLIDECRHDRHPFLEDDEDTTPPAGVPKKG